MRAQHGSGEPSTSLLFTRIDPEPLATASIAQIHREALADGNPNLVVPKVVRPYVTERVLVLELIDGEKVTSAHGLSPERAADLARELFRFYVRQVTIEGVYHADRTAAMSCSRPTAGSRCSTSASSAASTTTRAAASRCCCSRLRRTAPRTSPT